jgi:hypothetical protein
MLSLRFSYWKSVPVFAFLAFFSLESFAIDTESDREAVVSARSKKFYKSNSARQYLSLGGNYSATGTAKSYEFNSRYLYQSSNQIHEFNFQHESSYGNLGSAAGKRYLVKKSELYDGTLSSKFIIGESKNYGVGYHRTIYDDLSKYYMDQRWALGAGRLFLNDNLEIDASIGYQDVKTYGHKWSFIPSFRANIKLSPKFTLNSRGYLFIDHESMDNELKTSLIYRFSNRTSFEIRYTIEQRRYEVDDDRVQSNAIAKVLTFGLVFDLD